METKHAASMGVAAARAAAVVAFLSAGVTVYWTLGGTGLLDTLGGSFAKAAREHTASTIAFGLSSSPSRCSAGSWPWPLSSHGAVDSLGSS